VPREERREGEGIRTGLCCRWEKRKGGRGSTQRGDRIRPRWRRWRGWRSSTAACGGIQDAWIFAAGGGEGGGTVVNRSAEKQSSARGGRERGFSQRSVCKTEETQGLYGKLTFPIDTEI
jgi:hypothetical protein